MSYDSYKKACDLLPACGDFESFGGKTCDVISQAERVLDISFSKQCKNFYEKYDYSIIYGEEIFGIKDGADSDILEGNIVAYSLYDRKMYGLPKEWIPFYNFGDFSMAYYDYATLNDEQEPRIIRASFIDGRYEIIEVLADDFGDFLCDLISMLNEMS